MEEQTIWVDRPVLRDVLLNPWLLALACFGGIGLFIMAYLAIVRLTTKYTFVDLH